MNDNKTIVEALALVFMFLRKLLLVCLIKKTTEID